MPEILCPICGEPLAAGGAPWRCPRGHSFDVARQGYVNLLPVTRKHSLHPGDTKEQVAARRAFLEAGYYAPIAQAVCGAARAFCPQGAEILDAGCGEGYYSAQVAQALPGARLWGLDISKDAVRLAAGRYKGPVWLCGTAAHLPFPAESFHLVMSLFALTAPEEFARVLRKDGVFLQVLAAEDHLLGLKRIIYPELLHREKDSVPVLPGFRLLETRPVRFSFRVEGAQIQNLLSMTPHFWRITREGAARLAAQTALEDTASAVINLYRRETEPQSDSQIHPRRGGS
ncbi:MAG: methyltransferase domain-containing protein [Firmicutes bacterium]|nr:methyltransferase domain-containing protein [Clostridiales bacterium]MDD7651042.1 methyltransferase domain-containing protein [Bacillota bacterium]